MLSALVAFLGPLVVASPLRCPEGLTLIGDPPPAGYRQWCAVRADDGKLTYQGPYRQWRDDGTLELEGDFELGQRHGRWSEYDARGASVVVESTFDHDVLEGPYVGLVEGVRMVGQYKAGQRDGVWAHYRADGKKISEGPFLEGLRQGAWTLGLDGGWRAKGEFVDDQRQGTWTVYGRNGVRRAQGPVVNGVRQGLWTEYDSRGQLLAKGSYEEDQRHGRWTVYSTNGKKQGDQIFSRGSRVDGELPRISHGE